MEPDVPPPRRGVSRLAATLAFVLLAALAAAAVRRAPAGTFARLGRADPLLLAAGLATYAFAFLFRGLRLNLLLPPAERLPAGRAASLSAASLFLVQVVPLRGGELATWAAIRSALGTGWLRSGAVYFAVKLVDTAVLLLAGLAGAAATLVAGRSPGIGAAAGAAAGAGALLLLFAPRLAGGAAGRLAARFPEGSRRARFGREVADALAIARGNPRRYLGAVAASATCTALLVLALSAMLAGLGVGLSPAGVAVALLLSALTAAAIPSPVGNFGPSETGFTAGLALAGIPLPVGVVAAGILHLLSTVAAGLAGLPFLLRRGRTVPT